MKNKTLFRLFSILFVLAIFSSCSKDNSTIQPIDTVNNNGISEKFRPSYSSGVMGYLTPAPISAAIKIFSENGLSIQIAVNPDGTFKSNFIRAGVYNMLIAYVPANSSDDSNKHYFEVNKVEILADGFTDLGQIKLP